MPRMRRQIYSTPNGEERWERYYSDLLGHDQLEYHYRAPDGQLFVSVAKTIPLARQRRDEWLKTKGGGG